MIRTAEGAKHISEALKENETLADLHLEWNRLGEKGAEHFAEGLKKNKSLTSVNLRLNELDEEDDDRGGAVRRQKDDASYTRRTEEADSVEADSGGDGGAQRGTRRVAVEDAWRWRARVRTVRNGAKGGAKRM